MQLTNYLWYESYWSAICETDDTKKAGLILEARSAIEQRLLSPVRPGSDEEQAIKKAQKGIAVLTADQAARVNGPINNMTRDFNNVPDSA
jgi:hypothetical protein